MLYLKEIHVISIQNKKLYIEQKSAGRLPLYKAQPVPLSPESPTRHNTGLCVTLHVDVVYSFHTTSMSTMLSLCLQLQ